ncbi:hypothetical protein [Flavicella sp.]|uniref:hypothetical protein n=1 Tax=Flavicella sp. TaxID=2957742 RepID=UPI00301A1697
MKVENHSLNSGKSVISSVGVLHAIHEYLNEKAEGLSMFEKIMLTLYSMMTMFFLFSAVYLVLTKGFKF